MTAVLVIAGAIVVLDQVTKQVALETLAPGVPVRVIDDLVSLTLVMNPGLAFGMLASVPAGWRWVVALLSVGALIVLARLAMRVVPAGGLAGRLSLGLIFGGAVGNLIDRAVWGAVVDFVDLHWRGYHWPAFNVADSAISVGVVLLALHLMRRDRAAAQQLQPSRRG
jgi:signal peptidase II